MKPSASEAKYILVFVDLFSSYIYTYGLKSRMNLVKKIEQFYNDIKKQRPTETKIMRVQTDSEFTQNQSIQKLNKRYNVEMYTTKTNRGHAFAAKQKIQELKKLLVAIKRNFKNRLNNYKIIKLATDNLNKTATVKYSPSIPEKVQKLTLENKDYKNLYNAFRLDKVTKASDRYNRYNTQWNEKIHFEKIRVGDKVLVASYRLLKSSDPGLLDKRTTDKKSFYNHKKIFTVSKVYETR